MVGRDWLSSFIHLVAKAGVAGQSNLKAANLHRAMMVPRVKSSCW